MEAPHLKSLQEKYGSKGFRIVAVNAWDEPREKVEKFVKAQGLPYTILMNGRSTFRGAYRGSSIPQNYLLDREGHIVLSILGWDETEHTKLESKIKSLVSQ